MITEENWLDIWETDYEPVFRRRFISKVTKLKIDFDAKNSRKLFIRSMEKIMKSIAKEHM